MKVGTIIERVQSTFGDQNETLITIPDIISWINSGNRKIARETKCLQKDVDIAIDVTANGYPLPSDFINVDRMTYLGKPIRETTLKFLTEVNGDTDVLQGTQNSPPDMFFIWGRKIYLYPWPKIDAASNLHMWYTRTPVDVDSTDDTPEIPDFMHEDLVQYCLVEAHKKDANWDAATKAQAELTGDIAQSREEQDNPQRDTYPSVRMYDGDLW